MQILHLKTRIKRENSILPRHLTAVKVGVIYCSGGVTAVYCTTPVHPPVGELRMLHSIQNVISVSSNWLWPSGHHVPSQSHLFTAPSGVQPGDHLSSGLAGNPPCWRGQHTLAGGHWRLGWEAASQESEQWSDLATFLAPEVTTPPPSVPSNTALTIQSQFGYKKFWLATSRVMSRLTSISGTKTGF